jgi:acyl-CoA thioester hydrolase
MPEDFVLTIVPRWADIDLNQHMRHSAFADWAGFVHTEWLSANGVNVQRLVELKVAPLIFEDRTRYFKEIFLGERVTVDLQLAGTSRDASHWLLRNTFRRYDTVCAVHEARGTWFNIATRRITSPPPGLMEAYANIVRTDDYTDLGSKEN